MGVQVDVDVDHPYSEEPSDPRAGGGERACARESAVGVLRDYARGGSHREGWKVVDDFELERSMISSIERSHFSKSLRVDLALRRITPSLRS